MKRSPLKRTSTPLKRSSTLKQGKPLKKSSSSMNRNTRIKVKARDSKWKADKQQQREDDRMFYEMVWEKKGPYSEVSGEYLGAEVNKTCIDHLLEKSKYPHLRYEIENILLVTIQEHSSKTNGFPHPKHQEAIDKAKERYGIV